MGRAGLLTLTSALAGLALVLGANMATAQSFKGTCTVTASTISGRPFATLKCFKASDPGNYLIRSTKWARDDKKGYNELARLSGRRFSCTFSPSGSSTSGDAAYNHYKMSDCR